MSIKSHFYKFVKTLLLGGTYVEIDDSGLVFTGLKTEGKNRIKHFEPWNEELTNFIDKDNYPVPAVFFEFPTVDSESQQLETSKTNLRPIFKDRATFSLHLITTRGTVPGNVENNYLAMLDLAGDIVGTLFNKSAKGIKNIIKINETEDNDNAVLKDWVISFEVILTECGATDSVDANDETVNVNAPVDHDVIVDINKQLFGIGWMKIGSTFIIT